MSKDYDKGYKQGVLDQMEHLKAWLTSRLSYRKGVEDGIIKERARIRKLLKEKNIDLDL